MKKETIRKKLAKSDIKKNSLVYKMIEEMINDIHPLNNRFYSVLTKKLRPNFYSGTGRFSKVQKHEYELSIALNVLKIKYIKGNDAPRGSLCGVYFKILTNIE
jgi:hypothetical protein